MWGFTVRGSWRPNITEIFWPQSYGRQRCVFLVLQYCSTGGSGTHSAGWWLSLLDLISNFSGPQTPSGFPRPPRPGVAFPTTPRQSPSPTLLATQLACRTHLNYINVRRPYSHVEDFSPWEFFSSSHFISQFPPTRFPHITAIGMCHFFPVHHLEWHFARAEGQNITLYRGVGDI